MDLSLSLPLSFSLPFTLSLSLSLFVHINFEARKLGNLEPILSPPGTTWFCAHTCTVEIVGGNQLDIHQQLHITPRSSSLIVLRGRELRLWLLRSHILAEFFTRPPRPCLGDSKDTALRCLLPFMPCLPCGLNNKETTLRVPRFLL